MRIYPAPGMGYCISGAGHLVYPSATLHLSQERYSWPIPPEPFNKFFRRQIPKPSAAGPQTPMQVFFTCVIKIKELPQLALIMRQHFKKKSIP